MLVVHYQRADGDKWIMETLEQPQDQLALTAVGMSITLEQIYRKVELVADGQELSA